MGPDPRWLAGLLLACALTPAAAHAATPADATLVAAAHAVERCQTGPGDCLRARQRLQRIADALGAPKAAAKAPALRVTAWQLRWKARTPTQPFLLSATSAGRRTLSVVHGGVSVPPVVSGRAVRYRVRTIVVGAPWSASTLIRFPRLPPAPIAATPAKIVAAATTALVATVAALTVAVTSGGSGSGAAPASTPTTPPPAASASAFGPRMGINLGAGLGWSLGLAQSLGASAVRVQADVATPVSTLAPLIGRYADAGLRVNLLAIFDGRIPTTAENANLATWAAAFGPGGSFWLARGQGTALAVDRIEFGNESSGQWEYPQFAGIQDFAHSPQYADLAERYGRSFREASIATAAANNGVKLLAVANSPGRWPAWMDGIFRAVPDFGHYVGGWVVHPYGPDWAFDSDDALAQAAAHGASGAIPIYATETGISTDDGRCLDDNYGWDPCMTYAQAADALKTSVAGMVAHWGPRLREVDLYSAADLAAPGTGGREDHFGGLTNTQSAKGPFTAAMRALLGS